jgi:hypothetical protein
MTFNRLVDVTWQGLSYRPYTITDSLIPGLQFGQVQSDSRLDYYEFDRLFSGEDEDEEWQRLGSFTSTSCTIQTLFERAVKVRIRAVLRDGTRTDWAYSGWLSLYGMTAEFSEFNNALFLGFV